MQEGWLSRIKWLFQNLHLHIRFLRSSAQYYRLNMMNWLNSKKNKIGHSSNPIDSIVYDYNIRGWLLGANRNYARSTTSNSNYFGFDLGYEKTAITTSSGSSLGNYTTAQYNGNIAGMVWKSTGDDQLRKYDYSYDAMNRLLSADFNQYSSSSFNKTAGLDFSTSNLSYDANGNLLSQWQRGWKITGSFFY